MVKGCCGEGGGWGHVEEGGLEEFEGCVLVPRGKGAKEVCSAVAAVVWKKGRRIVELGHGGVYGH